MTLTVNRAVPSFRLALLALFGLPLALSAQVEVNSTLTPEQYVNDVLLGTGVEATNVQFTGSPMQIGEITGFDPADFPIEAGLILSTEVANNPANVDDGCQDEFIDDNLEVSGDADLLSIANSVPPLIGQNFSVSSVNDVCAIEFDFVATGDTVRFNYVFGSDEYLAWPRDQRPLRRQRHQPGRSSRFRSAIGHHHQLGQQRHQRRLLHRQPRQ